MISEAVLMDNMEYMAKFKDKFFDLAIVDPPYGINSENMQMGSHPTRLHKDGSGPGISVAVRLKKGRLNSGGGHMKNSNLVNDTELDWDNEIPKAEYFTELFRVSKNQIIWGGNYFPLPQVRGWIIWDKKQPWDNFSQAEMAWTSFDIPTKLFSLSNRGGANDENKIHPTQKPTMLYNYCYATLIKLELIQRGANCLDTHLGSGTHRISAKNYEMNFYSCDNKKSYFEAQEKRFKLYTAQLGMFSPLH